MDFFEIIKKRRSCRCFDPNAVITKKELYMILSEMQQAPSWKNLQGGRCYIAESKEAMEKVYSALPEFNQRSSKGCNYFIVTTYVKGQSGSDEWSAYDLGLQNAYLCLAATNKGYDTLIMGLRDEDKLREYFKIPADQTVMAVIALGKAAKEPEDRGRMPLRDIISEK